LQEDPDNVEARELLAMAQQPAIAARPVEPPKRPEAPADPPAHLPMYPTKSSSTFRRLAVIGGALLASIAIAGALLLVIERTRPVADRTAHVEHTTANVPTAIAMPPADAKLGSVESVPAPATPVDAAQPERVQPAPQVAATTAEPEVQVEADKPSGEHPKRVRVVA